MRKMFKKYEVDIKSPYPYDVVKVNLAKSFDALTSEKKRIKDLLNC